MAKKIASTSVGMPSLGMPTRLEAVVSLVQPDAERVVDIGYDHGHALLRLSDMLPRAELYGVEQIPTAKRRFLERAPKHRGSKRLILLEGDGFAPLRGQDFDAALLAGMGERTILKIVSQGLPRSRIVVCTPQMPAVIRPAMARLGYGLRMETLAFEAGRFYEVMAFEPGIGPDHDPIDLLFGKFLLAHPRANDYLVVKHKQWNALLEHVGTSPVPMSDWPEPIGAYSGRYQQIKARSITAALRQTRHPGCAPSCPAAAQEQHEFPETHPRLDSDLSCGF